MKSLRLIFGDQLSQDISSLKDCDKSSDFVMLCELMEEATYVKHHKKKIAFLFSAMRHFAKELEAEGHHVRYIKLEDRHNTCSFGGEIERAIKTHVIDKIIVTCPGEYRIWQDVQSWEKRFGIPVEMRSDTRFLCDLDEFSTWAEGRKQLRMEYFYREMRKKYSILMNGDEPEGGKWNYDTENRKSLKNEVFIPKTYHARADNITQDVMRLVAERFSEHFGELEPFHFAVTREQALAALQQFIDQRLSQFGDYQDAMIENEPWMYHSHISFYLNCGLLLPLECVEAAEQAYHEKKASLNAVEGFIRQIIGWREYMRGIYWLKMPDYAKQNFFDANRKLPDFYWTAKRT